jgi:PAS domain S-box-containing protein
MNEITGRIVAERRMALLRELGARSHLAGTAEEACVIAAAALGAHPQDVPFALLYLLSADHKRARLAAAAGLDMGQRASPLEIDLRERAPFAQPWPLADALRSESMQRVFDLEAKLPGVPAGAWPDPPRAAVVCPLASSIAHEFAGLLVLGVSSRLAFDDCYRGFCDIVAGQVSAAIANARACEEERKRAAASASVDAHIELARASREALEREHGLRRSAEESETRTMRELAMELASMARLHEFSTRLIATPELQTLLEETLDATMALQSAHFGFVQLFNPDSRVLEIVASRGMPEAFMQHYRHADESGVPGSRALARRERVIIEDVLLDAEFAPHRAIAAMVGFRAVQSTPLFSRGGEALGAISTHFREPHRPLDREMRFTDLYARHAADLIERRRAEDRLRRSEEKYRTLFDSIDEGFCTVEMIYDARGNPVDYRYLEVNPSFAKQAGIADACGRRAREIVPRLEDHWFEIYGRIAQTGEPARFEKPAAALHRWYDVYAFRVGEPKEGKVAILFNDISRRKAADAALKSSEERFRRYFELGLVGMAITSPAKGCVEVNDELCRILGYERSELLRMNWAQLTYPDDLAADNVQFDRVLAGEIDGYTLDKRWIRNDGRVIHTIMAARCVRGGDGRVEYFVGLVQDITQRKRAEEKLAESERRFRLLVESIPHHVWSFRADGAMGYWNQRVVDYTGLTPDEMRQGGWTTVHPDDLERVQAAWCAALERGLDYEVEARLRGRDGRYRRFVCHAVAMKNAAGRTLEWFGTNTDVEDRQRAVEDLHKLQAELAHVVRATTLGELAASIAHEVNQPLAAVVTNGNACLNWLAAQPPDLREAKISVEHIVRDANRAADVIARIRKFLRRGAPQVTDIDLPEVIAEVVAMAQDEIMRQRVSLRIAAAAGLPAAAADRVQLQQVILNLVLNALDALSPVADRARILEIDASRLDADFLRVRVRDSGVGVTPEHRDRIFDAFHTTKPHGLGMGLAISRSIVEAHGGRLWATPNEGAGEDFQFTLPIAPP